jgi:ATP-dependent helicase/DNAse subunit B
MPVSLLLGPPGSGKTGRALATFKRFTPSEHQDSVRFIVPSLRYVLDTRGRLLSDPEFPGLLGDPVCTFLQFATEILAPSGSAPKRLSEFQKLLTLRRIIREAPSTSYFDAVRDCPSIPNVVGRAIGRLKSAGVSPEDSLRAVEASQGSLEDTSARKLRDLALLYHSYQELLDAHDLEDSEGMQCRALETARANPGLLAAFRCVLLDGFSAFTPVQQELIELMAQHCGQTVITLDYESDRPEVYACLAPTFAFLTSLPGASVEESSPRQESPGVSPPEKTALDHLKDRLFKAGAGPPSDLEPDESVVVLEAASSDMEAEMVASEINRLARACGYSWADFAMIARDIGAYEERISRIFHKSGIPVAAQRRPLSQSRVARTVFSHEAGVMEGCRTPVDYAAWKSVRRIMDDAASWGEHIGSALSPTELADMVEFGIRTGAYRMPGGSEDGVSLVGAQSPVARTYAVVFILGLLEARRSREDPLLRDSELDVLSRHLRHPIEPRPQGESWERYLFYRAACAARERLYLSDDPRKRLRSSYIDSVDAHFSKKAHRMARAPREFVPPFDQAATEQDLVERTVLEICAAEDPESQEVAIAVYNRLLQSDEAAARLAAAYRWLEHKEPAICDEAVLAHMGETAPLSLAAKPGNPADCPMRRFVEHELKLSSDDTIGAECPVDCVFHDDCLSRPGSSSQDPAAASG